MSEHPSQTALVDVERPIENLLRLLIEASMMLFARWTEETSGEERRQRQRYEAGDQNRRTNGHREFMEEPADDAAHEQNGNEHRGERQRHRQNREADFPRAFERGLHRRLAHLHMADD